MENIIFLILRRMRLPLVLLVSVYALSVLGLVLIPGLDDQGNPWHMDFFHAFYFVSFMGSTIGFGEIPYAFTDAQRMWVVFTIYIAVVAWLYTIGTMISLIQTPAFQSAVTRNAFIRGTRRIRSAFFLICGYGDTGELLVDTLTDRGLRAVAIDVDQNRINNLELKELPVQVPGLCADALDLSSLLAAGLKHRHCAGVVALTDNDHINLKIAITSKLINPRLRVICRAESHDAAANIASFGTEHIINPFDTFADHLAMALNAPSMYLMNDWLTSASHRPLSEPLFPPRGRWILCGYGRFGKAVAKRLLDEGNTVTVIEADPQATDAPAESICARGTEADTLLEADVKNAVGVVAGTDDDANNLSIVMTAGDLNPTLFVVARQNRSENDEIFRAARLDLVAKNSGIIASRILALITTPLTAEFLRLASQQERQWADELISRIIGVADDRVPQTWMLETRATDTPAVAQALANGDTVLLEHLCRDPHDRKRLLRCVPLLMKRGREHNLLPGLKTALQPFDQILFCGRETAIHRMSRICYDPSVLCYTTTGKRPAAGWVWRRLIRSA
ncbi:MAG: NAD-binding protein [Gammaproteobacteria bacterium]|nr:NAD-binding protein [Gammaproteobacteria bacterium]MDH3466671.1 NAD-binding protein [Gammaproteobacteria bacterium]